MSLTSHPHCVINGFYTPFYKFLYNYLFMIVEGKMVGVADNNGPMEFKTRSSAKIIAEEMINNKKWKNLTT